MRNSGMVRVNITKGRNVLHFFQNCKTTSGCTTEMYILPFLPSMNVFRSQCRKDINSSSIQRIKGHLMHKLLQEVKTFIVTLRWWTCVTRWTRTTNIKTKLKYCTRVKLQSQHFTLSITAGEIDKSAPSGHWLSPISNTFGSLSAENKCLSINVNWPSAEQVKAAAGNVEWFHL